MIAFELAHEWPCDCCGHLHMTDVHPADIDPPEAYCGSRDECPVDIKCLRELEAQVEMAQAYLRGALIGAPARKQALLPLLADALSEALESVYDDAGVDALHIRARIVCAQDLEVAA